MSRPTQTIYEKRRLQYNIWLASLDHTHIAWLCHARCPFDRSRSFEEYLNERYEAGLISYGQLDRELENLLNSDDLVLV